MLCEENFIVEVVRPATSEVWLTSKLGEPNPATRIAEPPGQSACMGAALDPHTPKFELVRGVCDYDKTQTTFEIPTQQE